MARFSVLVPPASDFPHAGAFDEVAETLHHSLRDLGHESRICSDVAAVAGETIVLGANLIAGSASAAALPGDAILYNLEQVAVDSPWWTAELDALLRRHRVMDYSATNIAALGRLGIGGATHCPIGHHAALQRISPANEDIDVLFYGSLNERRADVLQALQHRGLCVHHAFGVYGAERDQLIARSRIVLNIHFYEQRVFEIVRVSYLLANRRFVISERSHDHDAEADLGAGLVLADYDEVVDLCLDYLDKPASREMVADAGLRLIEARPQTTYLRAALEEVFAVTV